MFWLSGGMSWNRAPEMELGASFKDQLLPPKFVCGRALLDDLDDGVAPSRMVLAGGRRFRVQ